MLRGEYQPLIHGWYCVKQRDLVQLQEGVTWEEAKSFEAEFFQTTAPWADLDYTQRARLGSEKLAERLGGILSKLVAEEYVSRYLIFRWLLNRFLTAPNNLGSQVSGGP